MLPSSSENRPDSSQTRRCGPPRRCGRAQPLAPLRRGERLRLADERPRLHVAGEPAQLERPLDGAARLSPPPALRPTRAASTRDRTPPLMPRPPRRSIDPRTTPVRVLPRNVSAPRVADVGWRANLPCLRSLLGVRRSRSLPLRDRSEHRSRFLMPWHDGTERSREPYRVHVNTRRFGAFERALSAGNRPSSLPRVTTWACYAMMPSLRSWASAASSYPTLRKIDSELWPSSSVDQCVSCTVVSQRTGGFACWISPAVGWSQT